MEAEEKHWSLLQSSQMAYMRRKDLQDRQI